MSISQSNDESRRKVVIYCSVALAIVYAVALFVVDLENFIQSNDKTQQRDALPHYTRRPSNRQHGFILSLAQNASLVEIISQIVSKAAQNITASRG